MTLFYTKSTTYIYALVDPRSEMIRYVGKANDPKHRMRSHLVEARDPKTHRQCWLKGLLSAGLKPELFILEEVSAEDWQEAESFWIGYLRFIGCPLVNGTSGGEGVPNLPLETRERINRAVSETHLGKPKSPEHAAKIGAALKGQTIPPEIRAKMSEKAKARRMPRAAIEASAAKRLGAKQSEETLEKRFQSTAKEYIITSPSGEEFRIKGLGRFCREYALNQGNLCKALKGTIQQSQGWRIRRPDPE